MNVESPLLKNAEPIASEEMPDISANGPGLLVLLLSVVETVPSGGDRLIVELTRRWPSRGGPVTVLTTAVGARYTEAPNGRTIHTRVLSAIGANAHWVTWAYLVRVLTAPFVVWGIMKRSHPGLVLSSSLYPPDVVPALVARALGARWIHSWQLAIPAPHLGYKPTRRPWTIRRLASAGEFASAARHTVTYASQNLSLRLARRWCSKVLVPTQLMASEALGRGFNQNQIHIANYGVDMVEIKHAIDHGSNAQSDAYDGIFVGRFHAQKGLDDLIAAWRDVQKALPRARLAVVGDGTGWQAGQFKQQTMEFKNQTVSLLGVMTGSDKFAVMSRSVVFLFPSHHESWGHVVLEAMAVGLPVVGYDLPSSREAFGDAILCVPAFDVGAFADAVVKCLTDQATREAYRTLGQTTAKKYDWNVIAEGFAQSLLD